MFYLKARLVVFIRLLLVCKQALQGALGGRVGKGKRDCNCLWIEYLHGKSRCKMLIVGDNISSNVITLGMCFAMFVYIRGYLRFMLIGGNMTSQSTECPSNPESQRVCSRAILLFYFKSRLLVYFGVTIIIIILFEGKARVYIG